MTIGSESNYISFSSRKLFMWMVVIVAVLATLHFLPESLAGYKFNLDKEGNVPTWYSTILLYSVAICALLIYFSYDISYKSNYSLRYFWLGFSLCYGFLSFDEGAHIHEMINIFTVHPIDVSFLVAMANLSGSKYHMSRCRHPQISHGECVYIAFLRTFSPYPLDPFATV